MTPNTRTTANPSPVSCPKCGGQPLAARVGSYWRVACSSGHSLALVAGHTMKTKAAAVAEWNRQYGSTN